MRSLLIVLAGVAAFTGPARATDLGKAIQKEPAYQSQAPRYGLLVLGPKAETRLWLVFDSVPDPLRPGEARDYLYVDKNGNGDLTEPGERVEAVIHKRKVDVSFKPYFYEETILEFKVGDVKGADGKIHRDVKVVVEWYRGKERPATVSATSGGRQQGSDAVVFSAKAKDAPVVHIGGRLNLVLREASSFTLERGREKELYVYLGTPGIGEGTFASVAVEGVPKDLHPVAEIEFPASERGKAGRKLTVVLLQRC